MRGDHFDYDQEMHKRKGHKDKRHHGAQTFRRKKIVGFLDKLEIKRQTLQQQIDAPEFEKINHVILGELKATESIINEFKHQFNLDQVDSETAETDDLG